MVTLFLPEGFLQKLTIKLFLQTCSTFFFFLKKKVHTKLLLHLLQEKQNQNYEQYSRKICQNSSRKFIGNSGLESGKLFGKY